MSIERFDVAVDQDAEAVIARIRAEPRLEARAAYAAAYAGTVLQALWRAAHSPPGATAAQVQTVLAKGGLPRIRFCVGLQPTEAVGTSMVYMDELIDPKVDPNLWLSHHLTHLSSLFVAACESNGLQPTDVLATLIRQERGDAQPQARSRSMPRTRRGGKPRR